MRAIYLCSDSIIAVFITEFAVDTTKSYIVAEQDFLKGPKRRYIRSLYISIKILFHNKGMMTMESDSYITQHAWRNWGKH
jgi:hypothetical protein